MWTPLVVEEGLMVGLEVEEVLDRQIHLEDRLDQCIQSLSKSS